MNGSLIKFGGEVGASQVGSKNPLVAAVALSILEGANTFQVAQAQDAQIQSVGQAMNAGGIALG